MRSCVLKLKMDDKLVFPFAVWLVNFTWNSSCKNSWHIWCFKICRAWVIINH